MNDKKRADNVVSAVDNTSQPEKDLISSEDVLAVISGDQVALVEQMERAREVALEQKSNAQELAAEKAKKKLEEEEEKKKAIMDEVKRRKDESLRKELLAKEEAERQIAMAEAERQRQLVEKKRMEEEARIRAEQERIESERIRQEKAETLRIREEEKRAKEQARIDARKAKIEAKEASQRAKVEARENAKKAREEEKRAKEQARIDARKAKIEAKEVNQKAKIETCDHLLIDETKLGDTNKVISDVQPIVSNIPKNIGMSSVPVSQVNLNVYQPQSTDISQNSIKHSSNIAELTINHGDNKSNVDFVSNKRQKKESNLKYYMTFIFFALLILMVIFLPDISSFMSTYFSNKKQQIIPEITTGTLTCTMNTSDNKYDYYYKAEFNYRDNELYSLLFTTTIKGDQHLDAIELSGMKSSCDFLQNQTINLEGVNVSCSLSNGVYENIQKLRYEILKIDEVSSAYSEAGGTYPNYTYKQNIGEIEKQMKASNYTCERHS